MTIDITPPDELADLERLALPTDVHLRWSAFHDAIGNMIYAAAHRQMHAIDPYEHLHPRHRAFLLDCLASGYASAWLAEPKRQTEHHVVSLDLVFAIGRRLVLWGAVEVDDVELAWLIETARDDPQSYEHGG